MTDEFNKEVQKALNSIASLVVTNAPLDARLQMLMSTICDVLGASAARLLLTDKLPFSPTTLTSKFDERAAQVLEQWNGQVEGLPPHPHGLTLTDEQGEVHKVLMVPLVIGAEYLGLIILALPVHNHWLSERSSWLDLLANQTALALLAMKSTALTNPTRNDQWFAEEFLPMLSHELRSPLHAILGWVSVLQHPVTRQEMWDHALKTIERSARAQSAIINDLLDASVCFNHQPNLQKRLLTVHSLLQKIIASALPLAEQKGVTLSSDIRLIDDYVIADDERLGQAFWHLLSNAIKFTPRNGHIQLLAQRIGDTFELTLVDTGIGITAEFLPYAFDPFRQESARTTRKFGGLGLGLAIARHQIELHDGTIEIISAGKNQGTTVIVRLPLQTSRPVTKQAIERVTQQAETQSTTMKKDLRGLRVLVVDDDTDSLEIVRTILQHCNSEVQIAVNAQEALAILRRWEPQVLISDIQMPGMDGYELIRQICQGKPTLRQRITTIALTAYSRAEDRLKALTAGFHTHLAKPIDPMELVAVVTSLAKQPRQTLSLNIEGTT